ncbi:hypothetical protein [Paraflavitalea speifideaquila]|uniref:hypothetical protein n=1 Tax=Paraflavitalea speifideaquila TaxID=3076558 RepID=UPI0028E9AD02|nr:hypothetical protein [Paraflavitalea speifideiaquila]
MIINKNIRITDKSLFSIAMKIQRTLGVGLFNYDYSDAATCSVGIEGTTVSSDNIVNEAPSANPVISVNGSCTFTWLQDGVGALNVTSITGVVDNNSKVATLSIVSSNAHGTHTTLVCAGVPPQDYNNGTLPPETRVVSFKVTDSIFPAIKPDSYTTVLIKREH